MNNEPLHKPAASTRTSGSTGPRTESGKAVASQNARKHDLCSRTLHLSPEEWTEYNDMRQRYGRDLQPANDVEETLVDEICFNYWRLQQAREAELQIILEHPTELPIIALYIRYRTGYERAFYKALEHIQKVQSEARKQRQSPRSGPSVSSEAGPVAASVRSADPTLAETLEEQLEEHLLENRVRGELALPPLEAPRNLMEQLKEFVSQNPAAVPDRLLELMRKAA